MLGRLWRRLRGTERRIFKYFDGRRVRYADPLVVHRRLEKAGDWFALVGSLKAAARFTPEELGPVLAAQAGDTDAVVSELAGIVREAFAVMPFTTTLPDNRPAGLTDLECLDLLAEFVAWLRDTEAAYLPLPRRPSASQGARPADCDTGDWSPSDSPAAASAGPTPR